MDVFGDHWHGLDRFDVVLCSGLIYHVPNPMSLLMRLACRQRRAARDRDGVDQLGGDEPMMMFQGDEAGNPSNWWIPNRPASRAMLATAGFAGISTVWEEAARGALGPALRPCRPSARHGARSACCPASPA